MFAICRMLAIVTLAGFVLIPTPLSAQQKAEAPPAEGTSAESKESNAGQEDFDMAMDLKMSANDIDKNTKVIERLEQAIKKGLPEGDLALAKELLASSALERAKLQLQEVIKSPVGETMGRRIQRKIIGDLELAVKNDPKLGEAHLMLAKLMLSTGTDPQKVIGILNEAIENLGYDIEKRGEAYAVRALLQQEDEAKFADLKQAMKDIPKSVEVQRTLFALLIDRERYDEVYELGKELLDDNASNRVAIEATIEALHKLNRDEEALQLLDERLQADDSNFAMRLARASVYTQLDRFDEAIADATKVIEQKPNQLEGYFVRGGAYLQRAESLKLGSDAEDFSLARRDIESALEINPNSFEGIRLRALVASYQKRYDEAIQDMTRLAKNNPRDPLWLLRLATLYQLNEQPSMATKLTDQLISLDGKNGHAYRVRGDAKLSIGDQKGAIADYKKAVEYLTDKDDDRSGLLNNLAWLLATSTDDALRDGKEAVALGKEACEITEYKQAHILSTLAAGYAEIGDFDEAIKWSSRAVELGKKESHEQLEQLENELKSYQEKKPWREKQEIKENKSPLIRPDETIET